MPGLDSGLSYGIIQLTSLYRLPLTPKIIGCTFLVALTWDMISRTYRLTLTSKMIQYTRRLPPTSKIVDYVPYLQYRFIIVYLVRTSR